MNEREIAERVWDKASSYSPKPVPKSEAVLYALRVVKAIMAEQVCGKCRYTGTCSIEKVFHDSAIYENHKPEECFCIGFRPIVEPTEDEG